MGRHPHNGQERWSKKTGAKICLGLAPSFFTEAKMPSHFNPAAKMRVHKKFE